MEEVATGHVLFGLDPLWISTALLIVTYAAIMTEKLNASGKFIEPSVQAVTAAAASAKLPATTDFRVSIVNAPGADAYRVPPGGTGPPPGAGKPAHGTDGLCQLRARVAQARPPRPVSYV